MLAFIFAAIVVVVAALLAFGMAALLHLQGATYLIFVIVILLIGLAAAGIILYMHYRNKKGQAVDPADAGAASELDLLITDANRKLRTAQQGSTSLDALPLIYILGETGVAKTTQVIRSGLDPELLAGSAAREGDVAPTPILNLWFTRQAALLELGAAVRQSAGLLTRLVNRTRPKAYRSAFGSGAASRAAVVCLSADQLLRPDAAESLPASARATGAQLREISRLLGTPLPVYVIITKLDRVPHFEEYVRNLSQEEVAQALGLTLPKSDASAGVYADRASRELGTVLDGLCYALGEYRTEMLSRESDPRNAPGVYEFPREFGKLRKLLNQYLVELAKPSQLSANPYLRAFYFTGIRAQIIETAASEPVTQTENQPRDFGATSVINFQPGRLDPASRPTPQPRMISKRVPQWTFLPRLFPEVILGDKSALSATSQTAPARLFRRILFATFACIFLIYTILLIVSFFHNHDLESRINTAHQALSASASASTATPSLGDLRHMEELRQVIVELDNFHRNGAPWTYHLGLYQGDKLSEAARRLYFTHFKPMLLTPTQQNWLAYLRSRPGTNGQGTDYSLFTAAYDPLKAYLITAGYASKSDPQFLTPVFLQYWPAYNQIDQTQQDLAKRQAEFYGSELIHDDPYRIPAETATVLHAQIYLKSFGNEGSIYQAMLREADKTNNSGIDFSVLFPNARDIVSDSYHVRGAFTALGFAFMQTALKNPDKYVHGESWVLGDQSSQALDSKQITKDLSPAYTSDYIKEWRKFLAEAKVSACGSLHDAPKKLDALQGSGSPLMELIYTVSHNTAVDDTEVKTTFASSQKLVNPNATDHFDGPGNNDYLGALLKISAAVKLVAENPASANDPSAGLQITTATTDAGTTLQTTARAFPADPQSKTDRARIIELLNMPITCAAALAKGVGTGAAKAGAEQLCKALNPMLHKIPFNSSASDRVSLDEFNTFFAPETGTLATVYNTAIKQFFTGQPGNYQPLPNSPYNANFVNFLNRASKLSTGLYPNGAKSPTFDFTLTALPSKGIDNGSILMDGQRIPIGTTSKKFIWDGSKAQSASLSFNGGEESNHKSGTWAVFELVNKRIIKAAGRTLVDFQLESGGDPIHLPDGSIKTVHFELSGTGADILTPGYFSGLSCPVSPMK